MNCPLCDESFGSLPLAAMADHLNSRHNLNRCPCEKPEELPAHLEGLGDLWAPHVRFHTLGGHRTIREVLVRKQDAKLVIASWEDAFHDCRILLWKTVGDYQGDYVVLVERNGMYGFTVIAYGSCSGCDALEAAGDRIEDVVDVLQKGRDAVHWEASEKAIMQHVEKQLSDEVRAVYFFDNERVSTLAEVRKALKLEGAV